MPIPEGVPEPCQGCPRMLPAFKHYTSVEAELFLAKHRLRQRRHSAEASTLRDDIEYLRQESERLRLEIDKLSQLAIGCAGVKLKRVYLEDDFVDYRECQSTQPIPGSD